MTDSSRIVIADLPYSLLPQTDPREALKDVLAFSDNDWGADRASAWVYGIILGWDFDDPAEGPGLREEFRHRFGWTGEQIARLSALHEAFDAGV